MTKKQSKYPKLNDNELVFFQSPDGKIHVEVMYGEENVWLSQKSMAILFGCSTDNVSLHLKNIYKEQELDENSTIEDFSVVQKEGLREIKRTIKMYSLEAIIAVGYRVNSDRGREFRIWATEVLKNYIQKGYALDSDRMKYGSRFSGRYFDELYEEIREIRTSERKIYQKITDIYATSFDYSSNAPETQEFFATVQNKLHFAITGKTAAEIISERVNSKKDKMGLTSWRKSPKGKIMPSDVIIAKNYLESEELKNLDRIGNMYLDFAEIQAAKGKVMMMKDWISKLDAFLKFTEYDILTNAGKISNEVAKELALSEYEKYKPIQDKEYFSDFDKQVKKLLENNKK
ncbi:MAG: cell filamentation protein Fic [Sphingobacteriia bacterium]|nr:cell filamentation protein Fic [Sphingobacteriia bacterium]